MREFRPPVHPSKLRWVLVAFIAIVGIVPAVFVSGLVFSTAAISYTISGGLLDVESGGFFGGSRKVQLTDITESRAAQIGKGRRTAGTSMPGYCAGRFSYPDLGDVWQATDCGSRVVVVRASGEDRVIVISPPDREGFLSALRSGAETKVTLPPPDKGPLMVIGFVLLPVSIVAAVMAGLVILLGPSRMRYFVGNGSLEVRTLFGHKRFSTAGARAREHAPKGLLRVAGTAAPGYFTGIYREDGKSTRMYATERDRVVLFEGEARVLLSPEDRQGFLRALEAEGVTIERG